MIETTAVQKEVLEKHKYCGVCGAEIPIGLACTPAYCECCRADLCEKCIAHEDENRYNDCRIAWCEVCWEIGEPYITKIKGLEGEIEDLYDEWKGKCGEISG